MVVTGLILYLTWGLIETYWEWENTTIRADWFNWQWWAMGIAFLPLLRVGGWILWVKEKMERWK